MVLTSDSSDKCAPCHAFSHIYRKFKILIINSMYSMFIDIIGNDVGLVFIAHITHN